ncbi:hypothetical protein MCETHM1_01654 [Flavobacteriaceae bacterium]
MADYNMKRPNHWDGGNQHPFTPFKNDYQQRNAGYNRMQRKSDFVKHSGAKLTKYFPKSGINAGVEQFLVTGWRLSNKELISIKAVTTSKSKESEKGWFGSVAVTFTNTKTGAQQFHWGTMEKKTGKVVINEMAFVMNPKAKNGGYSGTFLNK